MTDPEIARLRKHNLLLQRRLERARRDALLFAASLCEDNDCVSCADKIRLVAGNMASPSVHVAPLVWRMEDGAFRAIPMAGYDYLVVKNPFGVGTMTYWNKHMIAVVDTEEQAMSEAQKHFAGCIQPALEAS